MMDSQKGKKVTGPQHESKEFQAITVAIAAYCGFNKE